jgi:hypothetical protein
MEKIQVYFPKEELGALREAARRSGRSVAEIVREAVRKATPRAEVGDPVAIWDGEPQGSSLDHDSIYDER